VSADTPRLLSLQVGLPRDLGTPGAPDPLARAWRSGFYKAPVTGPVWLGETHLAGDGQADLKNHGGPDKAVLVYAAAHYPAWCAELGYTDMPPGGFGENFTVTGQTEADVCIGDIYQVGEARVQVSQPRLPCWKIARRWQVSDLAARVQETGRTGWYLRVLATGLVAPGDPLVLLERPFPQWSIARANHVIHSRPADWAAMQELAACPLLAPALRESLARKAAARVQSDPTDRLYGPNRGA
jgi:MOSC domain-containing protein YiiM